MDPQQRLLLHSFAETRASDLASLPHQAQQQQQQQLGVFVGVSQLEYARVCLEHNAPLTAYYATGAFFLSCSMPAVLLCALCAFVLLCPFTLQHSLTSLTTLV